MSFNEGAGMYVLAFVAVFAVPIFTGVAYNWLKMKHDDRYARKWLSDHPGADWIDFIKHSRGER